VAKNKYTTLHLLHSKIGSFLGAENPRADRDLTEERQRKVDVLGVHFLE
jgi:hypothetical protein